MESVEDLYILNCIKIYNKSDKPIYNFTYCNLYGFKFIDVEHKQVKRLKAYDIEEIRNIINNQMQLKIRYISIRITGGIEKKIYPHDKIDNYHNSEIVDVQVYLK
jgi:hypothetical protein